MTGYNKVLVLTAQLQVDKQIVYTPGACIFIKRIINITMNSKTAEIRTLRFKVVLVFLQVLLMITSQTWMILKYIEGWTQLIERAHE